MAKIKDFGEKIGGARKDLWKLYGMKLDDLSWMNENEKRTLITKDNIWIKPDYESLYKSGLPIRVVYFMKKIRDACPVRINVSSFLSDEDKEKLRLNYIQMVQDLRDSVMKIKTEEEVVKFYDEQFVGKFVIRTDDSLFVSLPNKYKGIIDNKLIKEVQIHNFFRYDREISKKKFCYSEEEKIMSEFKIYKNDNKVKLYEDNLGRSVIMVDVNCGILYFYPQDKFVDFSKWEKDKYFVIHDRKIIGNNLGTYDEAKNVALKHSNEITLNKKVQRRTRKQAYVPPQLEHIVRTGENYRKYRNATGEDYQKTFQFRGGEFGNWLSDNDRQQSLNFGYDALLDLSNVLEIRPSDISLNQQLAIAFGSRGSKKSPLAHYERIHKVINLTKLRGAGSLAHEWAHALDNALGERYKGEMATENEDAIKELKSLEKLLDTMRFKDSKINPTLKERTDFYKNSIHFDSIYSKTDNGYWQSKVEMFARAFECYISDKLGSQRSDYLCGLCIKEYENDIVVPFPKGEERREINSCFDELIKELKEKNILHDYVREKNLEQNELKLKQEEVEIQPLSIQEDGQSVFDFELDYER